MNRTVRKKNIEERIKKVLNLEKELAENRKAQWDLGYITLDKPIRDGWYKTFKLRADISRNKNAKVYQEILNVITVRIWGRNKKYADKNWTKFFKKTLCRYQRPGIQYLKEKEYLKLSSKAKKHFVSLRIKLFYNYQMVYFCLLPRYYFQNSYQRAFITKLKITSPTLESREQEIMELLNRRELRKYSKHYNYGFQLYYNLNKRNRRQIKMSLNKIDIKQYSKY